MGSNPGAGKVLQTWQMFTIIEYLALKTFTLSFWIFLTLVFRSKGQQCHFSVRVEQILKGCKINLTHLCF